MEKGKKFSVGKGENIDWDLIERHRGQAEENHGQSLERLAERGGLSWYELYCVLSDTKWTKVKLDPKTDWKKLCKEILKYERIKQERENAKWILVEERLPENNKNILVSFENFPHPDVGRYETDKDGNGSFYPVNDDTSYIEYDMFVNAWMPLPEPYRESEK